jgi:phage portal protein BeeE
MPDFGGGWLGGLNTIERAPAMSVPTIAFIRSQLAGGVASMPLERYRKADDGDIKLDPGWCDNPDPAPAIASSVFWSWVIDDLLFDGKSTLIVLGRDSTGYPVMFRRVKPGQLTYDPLTLAWGTMWLNTEISYLGFNVPPSDVVVISGPHEGICNYGAATIQAAIDLETSAATAAGEPLPNIDLHQTGGEPLSTDKAQELVNDWKGARKLGATAYTPQNLDARVLGWSSAELQMIEARQYMATQAARMAGVNPTLVSAAMGSSSSYVYTNQADYRAAFLDDCLDSYLRAIEGRLSATDVTPRGQYVQFDRDAFTRLTLLQRVDVMVGALKSGAPPSLVNQLAGTLDLDIEMPGEPDPVALPTDAPAPPPSSTVPAPPPPRPTPAAPVPAPAPVPAGS